MRHNGGRRPEEILAEIERTRSDMDQTLTAIEHRLTPGQLVDQGIDYLRHSGANEFIANLGGSVKQNPLPVALVSIGLAWLMAAGKKPGEYTERTSETLNRASAAAESARHRLSETAQSMRERVSGIGTSARQQAERAKSSLDTMLHEQPLALGAIGLAIGAIVAGMAPRTRQEDELMGEARDRLMDQAAQAGKEKLAEAERVAAAAKSAAKAAVTAKPAGKTSTVNEQPFYESPGGPRNLP